MADIRPFRGVRYNQKLVSGLASVICPPYDVISPEEQTALYSRSDYNVIRLEYNRESPEDALPDGKYSRAASTFHEWLKRRILRTDEAHAFYLHEHHFTHEGRDASRRSLIACVGLEGWQSGVILPHENTSSQPKADRLKLLIACQAQFSPIFGVYSDPRQNIAAILSREAQKQPILRVAGSNGERHVVWCMTDGGAVHALRDLFAGRKLYIADGHHRYETALAYQQQRRSSAPDAGPARQPYDFTMMNLVSNGDPGLAILPQHRLIKGLPASAVAGLKAALQKKFSLQPVRPNMADPAGHLEQLLQTMKQRGETEATLGVWGLEEGQFFFLTPLDASLEAVMPQGHSSAYKKLDVSILEHAIIEPLFGNDRHEAEESGRLVYTHDAAYALKQALDRQFQLVFFLNPLPVDRVQAVADSGDRMPRKSTFFYPKPPSGLVIYRLEPGIVA